MREAFPRSDYYSPSAPPHSHRLTTRQPDLPRLAEHGGDGSRTAVPTFTANRSAGEAPSYAPAISPWLRRRLSPWPSKRATLTRLEVPNTEVLVRIADQPESTGLELAYLEEA